MPTPRQLVLENSLRRILILFAVLVFALSAIRDVYRHHYGSAVLAGLFLLGGGLNTLVRSRNQGKMPVPVSVSPDDAHCALQTQRNLNCLADIFVVHSRWGTLYFSVGDALMSVSFALQAGLQIRSWI